MQHSTNSSGRPCKREWRHEEKILPASSETSFGVNVTEKQHRFIKLYADTHNSGQSAMDIYQCKNMASARSLGSRLVKRFGLNKSKRMLLPDKKAESENVQADLVREKGNESRASATNDLRIDPEIDTLRKMYRNGGIPFELLYARVAKIALYHADVMRAVQASELIKQWNDERSAEHQAREMQDADIVDLLSNALSHVPRDKYFEVLKINRAVRKRLINERNKKIDIDAIVKEEQAAFLRRSRGEE